MFDLLKIFYLLCLGNFRVVKTNKMKFKTHCFIRFDWAFFFAWIVIYSSIFVPVGSVAEWFAALFNDTAALVV